MTDAAMVMPTRRVEMWFAGTAAQNRWTVGFRLILVIPQFIVLDILFIVFFVVLVIGWFAALFTGRLPEWAHTFLGGVIRWYTRVTAYVFLLTDRYPPFSFDDVEYPVRPVLPGRGPLNRVSVFFRIILAIPAAVFYQIVEYGLTAPLLFFMWIVVLVRGSMPPALYDAYAAFLRYQVRFHSWFSMLTSEYAWGMLGDFVPPTPLPPTPLPADASPAPTPPAPTSPAPRHRPRRHRPSRRPSRSPTRPQRASRWSRLPPMLLRRHRSGRHRSRRPRPRPPGPCRRRRRGSARRHRPRWIRCLRGAPSSCRGRRGRG